MTGDMLSVYLRFVLKNIRRNLSAGLSASY